MSKIISIKSNLVQIKTNQKTKIANEAVKSLVEIDEILNNYFEKKDLNDKVKIDSDIDNA